MPVYEDKRGFPHLQKLVFSSRCAVCGGPLNLFKDAGDPRAYVACSNWPSSHHDGITKPASAYQTKGLASFNIESRRETLEKTFGAEKITALEKYASVTTLSEPQATEIIGKLWPGAGKASPIEVFKALRLCTQYGLNPLMKHLFLIPFETTDNQTKAKRTTFACVLGITANRLIASRRHVWSFEDDTPRVASPEEEKKHYGANDPNKIRALAKVQDVKTGARVTAWGEWNKYRANNTLNSPKGIEKGNSPENMACIRAERRALDMLYPADMPAGDIPVIDDKFQDGGIDRDGITVDHTTGEVIECEIVEGWEPADESAAEEQAPAGFKIDLVWLKESLTTLKWKDVSAWLRETYKVTGESFNQLLAKLTPEQQKAFYIEIQKRLDAQGKAA